MADAPSVETQDTPEEPANISENAQDPSDEDNTTEYHVALYSSLTAEFLNNPEKLKATLEFDDKMHKEVIQQLDNLETLIQHGLDTYYNDWNKSDSYISTANNCSFDTSWSKDRAHFVFAGPWQEDQCFYIDLVTLEAFKVDADVDNLTEPVSYTHLTLPTILRV